MSPLEYHLLLSLASGPLYGYAIAERVASESSGALQPRAGSLYRVIARLVASGLVAENETEERVAHPGLARRYYTLTGAGRRTLARRDAAAETHRGRRREAAGARPRSLVKTLLTVLVRLFPAPFRTHFGEEIVEHAALDWERDRRRGVMAGARSFGSTVFDLFRSGLAERLRPSLADVPVAKKGKSMSFDLDGWGAALRHAMRTLRRTPGFTATVVGTLGSRSAR